MESINIVISCNMRPVLLRLRPNLYRTKLDCTLHFTQIPKGLVEMEERLN